MIARAARIAGRKLEELSVTVAVAESCTGGLIGHMLTNIPGSSVWFKGGVVAYAADLKKTLLGVRAATLGRYGAVSRQTASEMAAGVRKRTGSDIGVAVTGIAGPTGGTPERPVGTVFIAIAYGRKVYAKQLRLRGKRAAVKEKAAAGALKALSAVLSRGLD